jgi:hypothetical protein
MTGGLSACLKFFCQVGQRACTCFEAQSSSELARGWGAIVREAQLSGGLLTCRLRFT